MEERLVEISGFIKFLEALGILFAAYLIWLIIKSILTFEMNKKIAEMGGDIKKIKKKLKKKKPIVSFRSILMKETEPHMEDLHSFGS